MRILVVEDDPDLATMLSLALTLEGHQVEVAADGDAGAARGSAGGFDAAVVDLMLPGRGGDDVIRAVRSALGDAAPRLVLASAAEQAPAVAAGLGVPLVRKPFTVADLLSLIAPPD